MHLGNARVLPSSAISRAIWRKARTSRRLRLSDCGAQRILGVSYVVINDGAAPEPAFYRGFFGPYLRYGDVRSDAYVMRFIDSLDA